MWFSVVCTLIDNEYASSQWSKCSGLTRRSRVSPQQISTTVMTRIVVDKRTHNAEPHSICFFEFFFPERYQDRDTKKAQALSITFSQSDWFIAQNERLWLAITTRKSYHENSESSETTVIHEKKQLQLFSYYKYSSSRIIEALQQNIHIGICNGATMEEAIWEGQSTGVWGRVRNRTQSWRHWNMNKQLLNSLLYVLTRAFEKMVEQFFNCFTDSLEFQLGMFCSFAWPEMDMMWREGTLAFVQLLVYRIKGKGLYKTKTFKVLPSHKQVRRLSLKKRLAVERGID